MFELVVMMITDATGLLFRFTIHQDRLLASACTGGLAELVAAGRHL